MASLVSPLEAAWAVLLKRDPHEDEDPYLTMYMQGQEEADEEMYGDSFDEEGNPIEGLPSAPRKTPMPKFDTGADSKFNLQEHALANLLEHAEEAGMGAGQFKQPAPEIPEEEETPPEE
tara:strand:+ start:3954 stop:4310 length:357 start_codon:yes stop_codon:yes gene_type:complete